jgi:uncharacterized membrane protein
MSRRRNLTAGALAGVGAAAFVDEAVFHQLLHWHHLYDLSSEAAGLVSDGILHAFSWFATVGGLLLVAGLCRRGELSGRTFAAGCFLGAGGFQLYDQLINHKLLGLHQIRYGVPLLPYDVAWTVVTALLLAAGLVLLLTGRRRASAGQER